MKIVVSTIALVILSINCFACDCGWEGDFFKMANQADLVVKIRVTKKMKDSYDFNVKMEVEVIEIFKGHDARKTLTIWGDNGSECRPYIDYLT